MSDLPMSQLTASAAKISVKEKNCFAFQKEGECRHGEKCKYAHHLLDYTPRVNNSSEQAHTLKESKKKKNNKNNNNKKKSKDISRYSHTLLPFPSPSPSPSPLPSDNTGATSDLKRANDTDPPIEKDTSVTSTAHTQERIDLDTKAGEEGQVDSTNASVHSTPHRAASTSFPEILPRPQLDIPGFEGVLSCCMDWPQTKKGGVPCAQSALFNPLLACALGHIPGHCSLQQVGPL